MNTSNKEWLQAFTLRAISFLVLLSLPQSNSHNKGNIKLRTCRALQVCTIVLYCSFGSLACATEILPSCVLASNLYFSLIRESTRHADEHFEQRMTSSSHITRECLWHRGQRFSFVYSEKIRDIIMNTSNKEWLRALNLRANSFVVLWSLPQSNSHN